MKEGITCIQVLALFVNAKTSSLDKLYNATRSFGDTFIEMKKGEIQILI